ncbi:hypothetical protein V492_07806 [Pseudogymnoascus sp. VKM F-4246]|nr:hypothetical protein V492_07806 [Pseudogymnoascus sp. VKM F-4246]
MPTVHIIFNPNPHPDSDAALLRPTSPGEQEAGSTVIHIMANNTTPKPEAATASPSKLSRISTAAPVLVTAPAPSIPDAVDGLQEASDPPVVAGTEEAKIVKPRPSEEPSANVFNRIIESSERETSPVVADVEEDSGLVESSREAHAQEQPTALPITEDSDARVPRHSAIIQSPAGKPYHTGIQVPSQVRITDGFPYPPGLADYGILEEDWDKFTAQLTSLIGPQRKKKKKSPMRRVLPFGSKGKKEEFNFQKSLSQTFEYVRESQNNLFRPKGLLMRVDIPEEGVGMEFMDLYHGKHVDHLSKTWESEARVANAVPAADDNGIDVTGGGVAAQVNVTERPLPVNRAQLKVDKVQHKIDKAQHKIKRAEDKTLEKARKLELRALSHLDSAKKKMSKRIRIVLEPVTVLDNTERSEQNGWNAWIRHCDNYGSQLTN